MPQQVQVDGVGLVEFSDDFTPDEIASQVDNIFARQEMEKVQGEDKFSRWVSRTETVIPPLLLPPEVPGSIERIAGESTAGRIVSGATRGAEQIVRGLGAPENIPLVPLAMIPGVAPAMGLYFGGQAIGSGVGSLSAASTPEEVGQGIAETAIGGLMAAHPLVKAAKPIIRDVREILNRARAGVNAEWIPEVPEIKPVGGPNALQIPSTEKVYVRPPPGDRGTVVEGVPAPGAPPGARPVEEVRPPGGAPGGGGEAPPGGAPVTPAVAPLEATAEAAGAPAIPTQLIRISGYVPPPPSLFDKDPLTFRAESRRTEIEFFRSLGLSEADAKRLFSSYDLRSDATVEHIIEKLSPENKTRLEVFETGEGKELYQFDRKFDPNEIPGIDSKEDLTLRVVEAVLQGDPARLELGDRFVFVVTGLRRLAELKGTWKDISDELNKFSRMRSETAEQAGDYFRKMAARFKAIADTQDIRLSFGGDSSSPDLRAFVRLAGSKLGTDRMVAGRTTIEKPRSISPPSPTPAIAAAQGEVSKVARTEGGEARPPGAAEGAPRPEPPGGAPVAPPAKPPLKPAPEGAFEEVVTFEGAPGVTPERSFIIREGKYESFELPGRGFFYGPGQMVSEGQLRGLGFEPPKPVEGAKLRTGEEVTREVQAGLKEVTPTAGTAPAAPAAAPTEAKPTPPPVVEGKRLSYGEKYVAESGIEGAQKRLDFLNEEINSGKRTSKDMDNLVDEAENIRKAIAEATPATPEGGIGSVGAAAPAEFAERRAFKPEKGPLPDFQEPATAKATFAQPWGFERIPVLGAVMGGVRRGTGYINESLATFFGERKAGDSISSVLGLEYSWLDKPWKIKDGQIVNITPRDPSASRYVADVMEALQRDPNAFELTPEQRTAFNAIQSLEVHFDRLEQKHKVGKRVDNEGIEPDQLVFWEDVPKEEGPYFPRVVTSRPGGRTYGLTKGGRVGAKAFFEKPRMFETEAEGWQKGYRYEESVSKRVATRAQRLYKRIADKRLATDPSLGGITRSELVNQLKEAYTDELTSGKWTEERIEHMADSIEQRGCVYQPAFYKIIFPEETAQALNKAFPNTQSVGFRTAASINQALKFMWLGFDWGVGMIQLQPMITYAPKLWAKANYNAIRATFSPEFGPEYVRRNLEPVRELAQLSSSVGRLEDFMSGAAEHDLLTKVPREVARRVEAIPTLGKPIAGAVRAAAQIPGAFGRQFQWGLDVAKIELWKGIREVTPKDQWMPAMQTIESIIQTSSLERIGVRPYRALMERGLFLASSYYRGALNLVAGMGERGVSGSMSRRAMGGYVFGGSILFYTVGKALGMSDDEILRRFNPMRSDFMMWKVKVGGKNVEVGPGGIIRSFLRLGGNIAKTSIEHPENWKSLSPQKNPITRFYRGHAGPIIGLAWDQFSGRDYLGQDTDISGLRRTFYPLTLRTFQQEPGRPKPSPVEAPATFMGLNVFTEPGRQSEAEVRKAVRTWMRFNPRPEIRARVALPSGTFPQSQYNPLRFALDENDLVSAKREFQKLLAAKGNTPEARQRIEDEFNYRTASGNLKPFSDSLKMEPAFRASLSPKQKILYREALRERQEMYQRFRKMLVLPTPQR
jgi:hypothetical protein